MGAAAQKQHVDGFFADIANRSETKKTLGNITTQLDKTVTGLKPVGAAIQNDAGGSAFNFLKTIPISPNLTPETLYNELGMAMGGDNTYDRLGNVLQDVTGINLNSMADNNKNMGTKAFEDRLKEYILSIEKQIITEMKNCIERYLRSLINKNPEIEILLDVEAAIVKEIGKLREKLRRKIQSELDKLIYQKVKIQQISTLKQKITRQIRKLCPDTHHSLSPVQRISPSVTKKLQIDRTWELPDGITSLRQNALKRGPDAVYLAEQPDSTGALVEQLSKAASEDVAKEGLAQATGYSNDVMSDYINDDGSIA